MKLGTNTISTVKLGTNQVQKVYLGTNEVWTAETGLLAEYPGAGAAYSLRLLRSGYLGSAIRVRRASDNTEQNIGFVNNELDTSSLTSFCSGTNGFVTTWYDQSGNGYNATQSTAANQPQIVSSGSIIINNGKPTIDFSNGYKVLQSSNLTVSQPYTTFTYVNYRDVGGFPYILDHGTERGVISLYNSGGGHRFFAGSIVYFGGLGVVDTPYLYYALFNTTNSEASVNGLLTSSVNIGNIGISRITIGGSSTGVGSQAYIYEHIEYHSNNSSNRTGISDNINDFYSIY